MRKYFENITGIATGSDMVMKFCPNIALQFCGFKAEGIVDSRAWIKKSHYPFTTPFQQGFQGDYSLICTRNPLDCAPSYFFLIYSLTHVESYVPCLLRDDVIEYWKFFYKKVIDSWVQWHHYWIKQAEMGKPVFFFRFEDILDSPKQHLRNLMGFILGMTDEEMNGTVIERRIEEVIALGAKSTQVYKPKSTGTNKNLKHYTQEMIEYAKEKAGDLLHIFGYVDVDESFVGENKNYCRTPFF